MKGDVKVNKALLEYKMKEKGKSISDMCLMLGISRSAFYRKCIGKSEFTQSEIQKIVNYLDLDSPMEIFFAH
jgi:ACT domain-containing protein